MTKLLVAVVLGLGFVEAMEAGAYSDIACSSAANEVCVASVVWPVLLAFNIELLGWRSSNSVERLKEEASKISGSVIDSGAMVVLATRLLCSIRKDKVAANLGGSLLAGVLCKH